MHHSPLLSPIALASQPTFLFAPSYLESTELKKKKKKEKKRKEKRIKLLWGKKKKGVNL